MPKITVSRAKMADAEQIGKIAFQTADIHYKSIKNEFKKPTLKTQTEYIRKSISDTDLLVLKATMAGQIAGYVVVYFNTYPAAYFKFPRRAFIGSIGVDKNARGQGVGKALLKAAESAVKRRGISVLEIDVYTFNKAAEKLYVSCGYEDIKHYKRKFIK
ncbi:MAG: GNAT family N-acetyltransferase [Pseudomonadota bacterium]|nr:GNAT family N-acetyltransferase [Pseudomonadota bacterium]